MLNGEQEICVLSFRRLKQVEDSVSEKFLVAPFLLREVQINYIIIISGNKFILLDQFILLYFLWCWGFNPRPHAC